VPRRRVEASAKHRAIEKASGNEIEIRTHAPAVNKLCISFLWTNCGI
jgi:hypothetical protein